MWTRTWAHDLAANAATPACIANWYYPHGLLSAARLIQNKFGRMESTGKRRVVTILTITPPHMPPKL
jgi:hypothetical protein